MYNVERMLPSKLLGLLIDLKVSVVCFLLDEDERGKNGREKGKER